MVLQKLEKSFRMNTFELFLSLLKIYNDNFAFQKRPKEPVKVLVELEGPELRPVCRHLRAAPIPTVAVRVPVPVLPIHRIRKQVSPTSPS